MVSKRISLAVLRIAHLFHPVDGLPVHRFLNGERTEPVKYSVGGLREAWEPLCLISIVCSVVFATVNVGVCANAARPLEKTSMLLRVITTLSDRCFRVPSMMI